MSVNEPTNGNDSQTMNIAASPEYQILLDKLARRNGGLTRSAMVRVLIQQEANRQGLTLETEAKPA
jgi:hypothetical protein